MRKNKLLLDLLLTFMKIGLFTFGGGSAMIPMIENTCVEKRKWITHDEMMNITVIAESTPGPIAINCATYIGYQQAGIIGSLLTTLGVAIPSFLIIFIISAFLNNFLEIIFIAKAFKGIKIAVGILIIDAAVNMIKKMQKRILAITIMLCSFVATLLINIFSWNISSIILMLIAAGISFAWFFVISISKLRGGENK